MQWHHQHFCHFLAGKHYNFFSDSNIASKASIESEKIINAFIKLCENKDFISSLETTTKSLVANRIRFSMWAEALNRELGTDIKSPFD